MTDRPGPRLVSRELQRQHQAQIDREIWRENLASVLLCLAILALAIWGR